MLENRVLRYTVYAIGASVLSEVLCHAYRRVCAQMRSEEIYEVIWTNELTHSCTGSHIEDCSGASSSLVENQADTRIGATITRIVSLPAPTAVPLCDNRYCASHNVGRLIALIDQAQHSLDLAMYTFTSYDLALAFHRALRRGVDVRIISDKEMVYSSGSQIIELSKGGIAVRCPSSTMLMHHKFCILDGPQRRAAIAAQVGETVPKRRCAKKRSVGIVISGSLNWTMQGFGGNWENIIITSNEPIIKQYEIEFERMWQAFQRQNYP